MSSGQNTRLAVRNRDLVRWAYLHNTLAINEYRMRFEHTLSIHRHDVDVHKGYIGGHRSRAGRWHGRIGFVDHTIARTGTPAHKKQDGHQDPERCMTFDHSVVLIILKGRYRNSVIVFVSVWASAVSR